MNEVARIRSIGGYVPMVDGPEKVSGRAKYTADLIQPGMLAGRIYRSAMITEIWNTMAAGQETTLEQRSRCRLAPVYAAECARDAMDLMYRHGGTTSFKSESRLAECWRDLHVVGQTVTIGPEWYPIGGRALLGMDTGSRLR